MKIAVFKGFDPEYLGVIGIITESYSVINEAGKEVVYPSELIVKEYQEWLDTYGKGQSEYLRYLDQAPIDYEFNLATTYGSVIRVVAYDSDEDYIYFKRV